MVYGSLVVRAFHRGVLIFQAKNMNQMHLIKVLVQILKRSKPIVKTFMAMKLRQIHITMDIYLKSLLMLMVPQKQLNIIASVVSHMS